MNEFQKRGFFTNNYDSLHDVLSIMINYLMRESDIKKIDDLENPKVWKIIKKAINLMKPKEIIVLTDNPEEISKFRKMAIDELEEKLLALPGHTIHYDGYFDQARDKEHTAVLLPTGQKLSRNLNVVERKKGLKEIFEFMNGAMENKTMIIRFFCLGPRNSQFSICALQITDSFYVAHTEDILYRPGYEEFRKLQNKEDFFYFWHSAGELDERLTTINVNKRRIYIDPLENRVLSINNQYAGNSLACKKLALRLAINKANNENWLTEHMFISAFYSYDRSRKTYFAGAYPSACGKTSTAMIPGTTIVGDDIAYLREGVNGDMRGVNIEKGVFGIIRDVNLNDDPEIFKALTTPKELIFSNVFTTEDGKVFWDGMGPVNYPNEGINHAGKWKKGDVDELGNEIPLHHPNARFTLSISELTNADENLHNPEGVPISGILYGGRDSDTTVPIVESLSWDHGVFIGATIESETTSATLGTSGVRSSNPMANMDFIIVPLGKYLSNHIKFGHKLRKCPKVFATNYFIKDENGKYLNSKVDKKIWLMWAEGRIHEEFEAIATPIGYLPKYEDLKTIFARFLNGKKYTQEEYEKQFSIRIKKYLEKFDRMEEIYEEEEGLPLEFWEILKSQRAGLKNLREKYGKDVISPPEL